MKEFSRRIAVVTGGGSGMGRELVRQLVAEGCNVAMCDVPRAAWRKPAIVPDGGVAAGRSHHFASRRRVPRGGRAALSRRAAAQHATEHINLLFNNAGIGGGGSLVVNDREEWDRTFGICWGGVYYSTRAFLPLFGRRTRRLVNTSSVNGFWASVGPGWPHTAYRRQVRREGLHRGADRGFPDERAAIKASVVMPGHIGTGIRMNSLKVQTNNDFDRWMPPRSRRSVHGWFRWAATCRRCPMRKFGPVWPSGHAAS